MNQALSTNIEQSCRLLSCGVDPKAADMLITEDMTHFRLSVGKWHPGYANLNMTPAWSLSAILSLLPKEIYDNDNSYYFSLAKEFPFLEDYGAAYIPCWEKGDAIVRKRNDSPIEACVQMIEWLCENNYSLNKIGE